MGKYQVKEKKELDTIDVVYCNFVSQCFNCNMVIVYILPVSLVVFINRRYKDVPFMCRDCYNKFLALNVDDVVIDYSL